MKTCKKCGRADVKFSKDYTTICNTCRGWDFRGMDSTPAHREAIAEQNPVRHLSKTEIARLEKEYEPPAKKMEKKIYPGRY